MIPRYTAPEMAELWSDETRYRTWFQVELEACRAMEELGQVPAGTADALAPLADRLSPARILEIEATTRHDVIAFLTHVEELGGEPARWLHLGLTSSDVLDTSWALLLRRALGLVLEELDRLAEACRAKALEFRQVPMVGRTHGIHAEPTASGLVFLSWFAELQRNRARLEEARRAVSVGKLAGAVGNYANVDPEVERRALARLGLEPEPVATQVVARDRHAQAVWALASTAAAVERMAVTIRGWQRTEVSEAFEPFGRGQKGSSAMPHKKNPILSENLCGLARVARAYVSTALENVALWHERDISHSSAERMMLPDVTTVVHFMLRRAARLVSGLVVDAERMRRNLEATGGLVFSERVLLALVRKGLARQRAYELVQRCALASDGKGTFKDRLASDPDVTSHLDEGELEQIFDLEHVLRHVDRIYERVLGREALGPGPDQEVGHGF